MTVVSTSRELELASRRGFITNLEGSRRGFITNYPNVTQWAGMSDPEMRERDPLNIYVHLPFCAQQCSYCYYRVISGARKAEMDRYAEAVCKELVMAVQHYHLQDRPIKSIYYGGGTPTLLQKEQLQRITQTIRDNFSTIVAAEFTIEGEPVTMTQKKVEAFAELAIPVTRISMGVQSLDDYVVQFQQRKDTSDKVIKAIEIARSSGAVVNIDLMSGLAGDSLETWKNSVNKAIQTGVESITVYKTEVYANSQYYRELRKNALHLPDDAEELTYMEYALEAFAQANYLPWCSFTFTKDGQFPHHHPIRIWHGEDYLPLGTSAFGKIGDQLFQNSNDPEKYLQMIEAGRFAVHRGHKLTCQDKMVRAVLLGMKLTRFDLDQFAVMSGYRLEKLCAAVIETLQEDGFITLNGNELAMTRKGILHGDYVGKQFGRALQELG